MEVDWSIEMLKGKSNYLKSYKVFISYLDK